MPNTFRPASYWEDALSWQAVTWVLEQSEAELGSRLVLLSIASHANREGHSAFPSLDTITRETLMSRREVIYCIQAMEEKGELHIDRGGGRGNPNSYTLPFVKGWLERVQSLHSLSKRKGATGRIKGAIYDNKGCNQPKVKPKESETSTLQPLENGKDKEPSFGKTLSNLSFPEQSKAKSWEEQKAALRQKGFLQ